MKTKLLSRCSLLVFAIFILSIFPENSNALSVQRWLGQTVYVPVYSHIYADSRFKDKPFQLTAIISIRNTDRQNSLILEKVDYYDSHGKLLTHYLDKKTSVAPLASTRYIVPEANTLGGSGAKFLVSWSSENAITEPIIEGVMIGTKMQQGISFVTNSRVLSGTSTGDER